MAKKYVPSGYQIIDLGLIVMGGQGSIEINNLTNEYKILYDAIVNPTKPILLKCRIDNPEYLISSFCQLIDDAVLIDNTILHFQISASSNKLVIEFTEL